MANFKVHARVLDLLGAEQIADMPTAVSELFKNGFDAYADNVVLELFRHKQHAILWDDGIGMSQNDLENRWLVVGTPNKRTSRSVVREGYEERPVMGEKGIGRLAISTLGDTLLLITKNETQNPDSFTALFLNWKVARNHKLMLDEFEAPVIPFSSLEYFTKDIFGLLVDEFKKQLKATSEAGKWEGYENLLKQVLSDVESFDPDLTLFKRIGAFSGRSGTAFYLGGVSAEVKCLTKEKDRFDTSDKSVYDQIVLLLNNFSRARIIPSDLKPPEKSIDAFFTDVRLWDNELIAPVSIFEDQEIFGPDDLDRYDHHFDVRFDGSGRYSGTVIRYGEKVDLPSTEQQPVTREMKCGPFGFRFWYWHGDPKHTILPADTWKRIDKKLKFAGGIMVYRDGLRVLPYGIPVNDWLNIEERRSKHAGFYFFSYRRMFGYVDIDVDQNPELKDKAGREGLIKNGAYRDLRTTLETFLLQMAALYFRDNPDFRERQNQIKADNELLDIHKKFLHKRREALLAELNVALPKLKNQKSRLESLRNEIENQLDEPDLSIDEMEEVVSSFEKRVQQLLGENKIVVPKNLSLGRGRDLNQAVYDYENSFKEIREFADLARKSILTKVEKDCPSIEKRLARRRLLETALSSGKMRVGKAFAELAGIVAGKTSSIASKINERRAEALQHVEKALLQATGTSTLSEAFLAEKGVDEAVNLIAQAASSAETKCTELRERYSHVLGNALSEDNALIMSLQDDRIEELEKKIQETVELAQIGLSVEMIHHDLHNMFRGISGSIRSLRHMFRQVPQAMDQVNTLQSTFQHLELRYRQLEPLYRSSYRLKRVITGEEIIKFVRQFLEHDLSVVGVTLEPTDRFLAFSITESPALIHPAFVNLVDNAIYWLRSVDRRIIRFDIVNDAVVVNDSGPGIHETLVERIFEAFTTTKEIGRGLGLYIARQSLSLANHEIWATNDSEYKDEPGACFCLKFSEKARHNKDEEGDAAA